MSLKKLWNKLCLSNVQKDTYPPFQKPPFPFLSVIDSENLLSFRLGKEKVPLKKAIGRISAELISPYPPGVPIILVDNGSTDRTVEEALMARPDVKIIENGINIGYGIANTRW